MASTASTSTYTRIGLVLAVLTLIEFLILYVPQVKPVAVLLLVALSIAKFTLVVQFFMHLRFERRLLGGVFIAGLLLSLGIWYAVWAIFYYRIPTTIP